MTLQRLIEKPSIQVVLAAFCFSLLKLFDEQTAREHLNTPGLSSDKYFTVSLCRREREMEGKQKQGGEEEKPGGGLGAGGVEKEQEEQGGGG